MKRLFVVVALLVIALAFTACTADPNELTNVPNNDEDVAGFWQGLVHGFLAPFTFLISLFSDSIAVYEVHNNGNWYNFGFLFGASMILGGSGGGAARKRR